MRVLLLGASGFLGRHVGGALASQPDIDLVRQVRQASSDPDAIALDLLADGAAEDLIGRAAPDAVVNCAGTTVEGDTLDTLNVRLVERLLRAIQGAAPRTRLVHLGSAAEYGPTPPGEPIAETTPAHPISRYGVAKLAATRLVAGATERGLDGIVLRVFNPIGAGMPSGSLAGNAARRLRDALDRRSGSIEMGPLEDWRDFLPASDVGEAVAAALRLPNAGGRPIVNVGSGEAIQARDLVRRLATIAGFRGEVREGAAPSARSAGVPWQQADTSLARRLLGWEARRPLDDALRELWQSVASG